MRLCPAGQGSLRSPAQAPEVTFAPIHNGHWYYCPECLAVASSGGRCFTRQHANVPERKAPKMRKLYPCKAAQAAYELGGLDALVAMAAERTGKPIPDPERLRGNRADTLILDDPYAGVEVTDEEQKKAMRAWWTRSYTGPGR